MTMAHRHTNGFRTPSPEDWDLPSPPPPLRRLSHRRNYAEAFPPRLVAAAPIPPPIGGLVDAPLPPHPPMRQVIIHIADNNNDDENNPGQVVPNPDNEDDAAQGQGPWEDLDVGAPDPQVPEDHDHLNVNEPHRRTYAQVLAAASPVQVAIVAGPSRPPVPRPQPPNLAQVPRDHEDDDENREVHDEANEDFEMDTGAAEGEPPRVPEEPMDLENNETDWPLLEAPQLPSEDQEMEE